jgi:hypothetical protein
MFITYLENDPTRSHPAWGWVLCFGLFVANATTNIASGVLYSISQTVLTARIKLQLNTLLFSKTLRKKDIASSNDEAAKVGGVADEAKKEKDQKAKGEEKEEENDEGVSSKSQIMVCRATVGSELRSRYYRRYSPWMSTGFANLCGIVSCANDASIRILRPADVSAFTIIDAPLEIVIASIFLFQLLGVSAVFGLLTTIRECASMAYSVLFRRLTSHSVLTS